MITITNTKRIKLVDIERDQLAPVYVVSGKDFGVAMQVDNGQPLLDGSDRPTLYGREGRLGARVKQRAGVGVCHTLRRRWRRDEQFAARVNARAALHAPEAHVALAPYVVRTVRA